MCCSVEQCDHIVVMSGVWVCCSVARLFNLTIQSLHDQWLSLGARN